MELFGGVWHRVGTAAEVAPTRHGIFGPHAAQRRAAVANAQRAAGAVGQAYAGSASAPRTSPSASTAVDKAEASISAFFVNVVPSAVGRDPPGLALARANTESIVLVDGLTQSFDALVRHHIELGFRPFAYVESPGAVDLVYKSVGFADLVGSTSWTQQLDFITLSHALTDFESRASEVVVAHGGRLVKLIGDEVMFVAVTSGCDADRSLPGAGSHTGLGCSATTAPATSRATWRRTWSATASPTREGRRITR